MSSGLNTEPGAVATGCYHSTDKAELTKEGKLKSTIRSLPIPVLYQRFFGNGGMSSSLMANNTNTAATA